MKRNRDRFDGLIGDRQSWPWLDHQGDEAFKHKMIGRRSLEGLNGRMLAEDLSHLFPYDSGSSDGFSALIEPHDDDVLDLILNALPSRHGPARTLRDGVRDFGSMAAQELVAGPLILELELYRDAEGAARAFRIHFIPNRMFWRSWGRPRQWVPERVGGTVRGDLHYRVLESNRVVVVDLGRRLRRELQKSLAALQLVEDLQSAAFSMISPSGSAVGFDFQAQRDLVAAFARKRTREIGWDGRGLFMEDMLEPYPVWRRLRFARFQLAVRGVIAAGLQEAIDRAGAELGFRARLVLGGLISSDDLDQAELDLQRGTRSLSDLTRRSYGMEHGD